MQKIGFNEHYGLQTAVFNGTKTKTRRTEKCLDKLYATEKELGEPLEIYQQEITREGIVLRTNAGILSLHTRYKIDEVVAVAQPYKKVFHPLDWVNAEIHQREPGWSNKMFVRADLMPHQIQITNIKAERLQDISDEDCLSEGIIRRDDMITSLMVNIIRYTFENSFVGGFYKTYATPREAFAALIERPGIGRKGDWNRNPWVVVYSFTRIHDND